MSDVKQLEPEPLEAYAKGDRVKVNVSRSPLFADWRPATVSGLRKSGVLLRLYAKVDSRKWPREFVTVISAKVIRL